jgi:hypothetical protein
MKGIYREGVWFTKVGERQYVGANGCAHYWDGAEEIECAVQVVDRCFFSDLGVGDYFLFGGRMHQLTTQGVWSFDAQGWVRILGNDIVEPKVARIIG